MIVKRCVLAFLFLALGGGSMVAAEGAKAVEDTLRAVPHLGRPLAGSNRGRDLLCYCSPPECTIEVRTLRRSIATTNWPAIHHGCALELEGT